MIIHVLTIETRHGRGVYAHATRAEADAALAAYVRERASEIIALRGEYDDSTDAEAVEHFYGVIDDESAEIDECELALPDPAPLATALQRLVEAMRFTEAGHCQVEGRDISARHAAAVAALRNAGVEVGDA